MQFVDLFSIDFIDKLKSANVSFLRFSNFKAFNLLKVGIRSKKLKVSNFLNQIVFFKKPVLLPNPLNAIIYVFILKVCVLVNLYYCGGEFNEIF